MTVKDARKLVVGDPVCYKGVVHGTVLDIKADSAVIHWTDLKRPLEVPHAQMGDIELYKPPTVKGRYDR